jgi:hypothetical protein
MFRRLHRFWFGDSLHTRMTEEEVRVLADRVAREAGIDGTLSLVGVRLIEGRVVWTASTATRGSGWAVTVDDATGEVGPVRRSGLR